MKLVFKIGFTLLFTLLMILGAWIHIDLPGRILPIVLSNLFLMLAGLLLGQYWGLASVCLYLLLGAIGVPVFQDATGGLSHFAGFKLGYLMGYLVAVYLIGWIAGQNKSSILRDLFAITIGVIALLTLGMTWLKFYKGISWDLAFAKGVSPFLLGAFIKAIFASLLAYYIRPHLRKVIN